MKTTVIKTGIMVALAFLMAISGGCKKEEMSLSKSASSEAGARTWPDLDLHGKLALRLINKGPVNFGAVNIEIVGVLVHYTDERIGNSGWMNMPFRPKIYNLMQLQDMATLLSDNDGMLYGAINGVRLVLGTHNNVVWADEQGRHFAPLLMTEEDHIANLRVDARVMKDLKLFITVDFNAKSSINYEGETTYILDPVLNLQNLDYE